MSTLPMVHPRGRMGATPARDQPRKYTNASGQLQRRHGLPSNRSGLLRTSFHLLHQLVMDSTLEDSPVPRTLGTGTPTGPATIIGTGKGQAPLQAVVPWGAISGRGALECRR